MWTDLPVLLAQDEAPPPNIGSPGPAEQTGEGALGDPNGGGAAGAPPANPFGGPGFIMLLAVMVLFIFLMGGGRREKKKRASMIAALGKGDRVQTIGGIRGTIVEIKDDELVLKVDENSNTRMRFASSAVQSVIESRNAEAEK